MSRKDLQAKKRHHYVWAHYLARWGNGTNDVFYTTKTGKIAHDSVRAIAVENYLYKITTLTAKHIEVIKGFSRHSPEHLQTQHMSYLTDILKIQNVEKIYRKSGIRNQEAEALLHATKCNIIENLHSSHEDMAQRVLAELADERLDILQDKEHMVEFMSFLGHQIVRTKAYRDEALKILHRRNALEMGLS